MDVFESKEKLSDNPPDTTSIDSNLVAEKSKPIFDNYHIKLWINTIAGLPVSDSSTALFQGKEIRYVDIIGTVVDIISHSKADNYILDDSTGLISCCVPRDRTNNFNKKQESISIDELRREVCNDSSIMLMSNSKDEGISELLTLLERELRVFTIGDTIQIKGKLSFFREKWKVFAHTIRVVDFEEENYRCVELQHLNENIF